MHYNDSFLQTLKIWIKGCCLLTHPIVVLFLGTLLFCLFLVFIFAPHMFSQLAVVTACCCYALLVLAPSYSCALLALTPCYCLSLLLARLASITLCLLSHLVVSCLVIVPCRFHTLLLCLATFYYHALLLSHLAILTPCCLTIVAPPSRVTTLP